MWRSLTGLRWLVLFHRWAGIILCLIFASWFASGGVLHFVPFPSLTDERRVAQSEPIEFARLSIEPGSALARVPDGDSLKLVSVAGRPAYVIAQSGRPMMAIAGDTGESLAPWPAEAARVVAERFGRAPVMSVEGPLDYDQWVVHQRFDPFRPFYRVALRDAAATTLYVSARTGEVLQLTTRHERGWNWWGAVLHWIYYVPLRKSFAAWDQAIWWLSLAALLSTVAGVWLGITRWLSNRRAGRTGLSPFRGWLYWHHIAGLTAGLFAVSWILSGWLSMDHGRLFSRGQASAESVARWQGLPLAAAANAASLARLSTLGPATEVRFGAVAGRLFVAALGGSSVTPRVLDLAAGSDRLPTAALRETWLLEGIHNAWPREPISEGEHSSAEVTFALAESLPAGVKLFQVGPTKRLWVYIDPVSGRLVTVMDASRRSYAWIYYALHTFNFPVFASRPMLRTFVVLIPLTLGFFISLTGVVVGVVRLRRTFT